MLPLPSSVPQILLEDSVPSKPFATFPLSVSFAVLPKGLTFAGREFPKLVELPPLGGERLHPRNKELKQIPHHDGPKPLLPLVSGWLLAEPGAETLPDA